jgi:beta-lactamase superfamily II metal-dependent hydrolase
MSNISVKLKMYPASNGDAFLISANVPEPVNILIDGGYGSTYKNYISPDLKDLASKGLSLNLVVATHIDADHILGLIEFFKSNGCSNNPKIIPVDNVIHNSVRSLNSLKTNIIRNDDYELLSEVALQGYPCSDSQMEREISAHQGSSLAALLLAGKYNWNFSEGNKSISCENFPIIKLNDNANLKLIGPTLERLNELKGWWLKELRRLGFIGDIGDTIIFDDAFEFLCAKHNLKSNDKNVISQISGSTEYSLHDAYYPDTSATNSSSVTFIAEIGSSKLLFLGDAWSEDIEFQVKKLERGRNKLIFQAIKISHHGSLRNTSTSLLELIDAPAYFISSNGNRHNHPDIEVLKEIVDRPSEFQRHLYFSYSTPASTFMKNYKSKSGACFTVHENASNWIDLTTEIL